MLHILISFCVSGNNYLLKFLGKPWIVVPIWFSAQVGYGELIGIALSLARPTSICTGTHFKLILHLFSSVLLGARCSFFLFRMSVSSYEVDSVSPCIFPCRKSNGCTNRNLWKWCHFYLLPSRALVFVKAVALLFAPESRTISQVGGWLGLARLLWLAVKKGNIF